MTANLLDAVGRYVRSVMEHHVQRDHMDLWTGLVMTVDTTNKRTTVKLRGDTTATTCQYMMGTGYTPTIGHYVYVLARNRSYLVIGQAVLV